MQRGNERSYYPAGSKFDIILLSQDERYLKIAAASLWALAHFGGLGTRSRRGAGNMVVTKIEDKSGVLNGIGLDFILKGNNSDEAAKWLINNFESARHQVVDGKRTMFISEYSNMSLSRFVISNSSFVSWKDALNDVGFIFKKFRDKNKSRIFDTASFGFPIVHRNTRTTVTGKTGNIPFDRRSSPIIFKVIRANNHFYWIVIRLAGELLPEGGIVKAGGDTQKPDYGILDEFWAELKEKGKEHILSMPDTLEHIIGEIRKEVDPQKIILFGSKARGDFHSRSDTDIAVESDKPLSALTLNGAVDVVNLRAADESLRKKIEKEGVVIYERTT
jgi:CRISPR-associated protein Cmr1